jgi:dipeptidyl-peptidase-4
MDMVTALIDANADFEIFLYPNNNHFISTGNNTTYHLYQKMTKFLLENLKP